MTPHLFFYLGLAFLTMHEMDAIRCREWRIFPGLSWLNDKWGFPVFLFAHIPIFYWVYLQLAGTDDASGFIKGFNIFMIIHLGLHILFLRHKRNEFRDWISWSIIVGAAVCGLTDLAVS